MAKKQPAKKAPKPKAASVARRPASSKAAPQVKEILEQLEALGNETMKAHNAKDRTRNNFPHLRRLPA